MNNKDTIAPTVRTKVYVWKGITYLPSYTDRFMYVMPGAPHERRTLAEAALHDLGAKIHYEMLWPRFWTNGVLMLLREVKEGQTFMLLRTRDTYQLLSSITVKGIGTKYYCQHVDTGRITQLPHSCKVELL